MLINALLIPKVKLTFATTEFNLGTALQLMEDNSVRSLPILDTSETLYRGNLYRYHIYQHLVNGGSLNDSVMLLIKNATKYVYQTDSFYTLFFTLKDLPYISVLDDKHHFLGIVRHTDVMNMLSESWRVTQASFALAIEIPEDDTSFLEVVKIVKKFTEITGLQTFDKDHYTQSRRLVITLPDKIEPDVFDKLNAKLNKRHFNIIEVEDLHDGI
ncbi:CBS domain-containing protein [Carnobacteriaceae bacterium zg-ZUI252]|nr:CBS domain-containing protein [Carnobacteriaceae bacterium zg-ZUI252]MBS4770628.1 CBS domain-containing protein [Carnobacteriaceae bacterium zg-ZUI240]QTU83439.1 CBS domain-containing protein [Carnobacteriaceae bacterium zg-C25]